MKYALVTGASGGIGREIALKLAKAGYGLYLHFNQNEREINSLVQQIHHVPVYTIRADLTNKNAVTATHLAAFGVR